MSAALINRSLTTIRTELEFLLDSEVIDEQLYQKLTNAIPLKFQKDSKPWGVDHLQTTSSSTIDQLSNNLAKTELSNPSSAPPSYQPTEISTPIAAPTEKTDKKVLGYYKALYDYDAKEPEDLSMKKDDKLAVVEHLSGDWWKGYKKSQPSTIGVFPSNYVSSISEQEFKESRGAAPVPGISIQGEKQEYQNSNSSNYTPPQQLPQQHSGYQQQGYNNQPYQQPYQQQYQQGYNNPNYQVQPSQSAPTLPYDPNYYNQVEQQQQQQQQQQPQQQNHPHLRKYGNQLGNSIVTGAGFTIGSDIVNSIFR
ncbi:LAS seventeen-binding protein 1 [[Candida] jaroonii]|uniref:LAS seventeen-binding protein 1 n=1 Tax=[Candida] jaroonii TaxID=467808 RepID=A0ACA9Y358_9ASCO|nr:LAS seventeen-binding protein 1 [[Candida] jaroonii]